MPIYANHLREIIKRGVDSKKDYDKPLSGFKIAVDAGNGSGGFLATDVLARLGADTSGAILNRLTGFSVQPHVLEIRFNLFLAQQRCICT